MNLGCYFNLPFIMKNVGSLDAKDYFMCFFIMTNKGG
jgi:hypothetical protein